LPFSIENALQPQPYDSAAASRFEISQALRFLKLRTPVARRFSVTRRIPVPAAFQGFLDWF
jgi:hypothetical protein